MKKFLLLLIPMLLIIGVYFLVRFVIDAIIELEEGDLFGE